MRSLEWPCGAIFVGHSVVSENVAGSVQQIRTFNTLDVEVSEWQALAAIKW
jgi:hypothetical protein